MSSVKTWFLLGLLALAAAVMASRMDWGSWFDHLSSVAWVRGEPISQQRLERALRDRLFRHGMDWEKLAPEAQKKLRSEVLSELVDSLLIRQARRTAGTTATGLVKDEMTNFVAEFHPPGELDRRLALQRVSLGAVEKEVSELLADQAWLESKIPPPTPEVLPPAPEVWRASHLFLSRHEKGKPDRSAEMKALHQRIVAGELKFADAVASSSEDERSKPRGGDLGWFSESRMPADFMALVKALPKDQLSGPVETKLGWHLIRVTDHRPTSNQAPAVAVPLTPDLEPLLTALRSEAADEISFTAALDRVQPTGYTKP